MIYPEVPIAVWAAKYSLPTNLDKCKCGKMVAPRPIIMKDVAGFEYACDTKGCGGSILVTPYSKESKEFWSTVV